MVVQAPPSADAGVEALAKVIQILEALDEPQRKHVVAYIVSRYGAGLPVPPGNKSHSRNGAAHNGSNNGHESEFADLGDFFDRADPQNQADRVLVVAYWKQIIEGSESIEAFPVSKELKNLGHGIADITTPFDTLINQSPKLVLQIAKNGKSRQGRKRYRVTREGVRRVKAMINGNEGGDDVG